MSTQDLDVNHMTQNIKDLFNAGAIQIGNPKYFEHNPVPMPYRVVFEIVEIDPDPKFLEVYPQKGGGLSLTGLGLKRLAKAMNIRWQGGQIILQTPSMMQYRAFATCLGLDGNYVAITKDYEFDLQLRAEEIEVNYNEKANYYASGKCEVTKIPWDFKAIKGGDVKGWIHSKTNLDMIQIRKNRLTRAQTGAQLRVIRDTGPIAATYTAEQLQHPFIITKLVRELDKNDPAHVAFALEQSKAPMMMFPSDVAKSELDAPAYQAPALSEPLQHAELELQPLTEGESEFVPEVQPDPPSPEENMLIDFNQCDQGEQCRAIAELIKGRNWLGQLQKPLENFDARERRLFFEMLVAMPKAPPAPTIPWTN